MAQCKASHEGSPVRGLVSFPQPDAQHCRYDLRRSLVCVVQPLVVVPYWDMAHVPDRGKPVRGRPTRRTRPLHVLSQIRYKDPEIFVC